MALLTQKIIVTLVFKKNDIFFDENCDYNISPGEISKIVVGQNLQKKV
jgi:hypothetical protein